jgi:hypothetical protein
MSGAQLRELFWPEGTPETKARLARRALARLAALELLTPLARRVGGVRAGSAGLAFALGRSGQRVPGRGAHRRVRRPHTPGERHLAHTLALSQTYVDLAVAQRGHGGELPAFDTEPDCWCSYPGSYGAQQLLKPDAYIKLAVGEYDYSWFIEQDMATEARTTIETKGRRYLEAFRTGAIQAELGVFPRIAWIAPDDARAQVIGEALGRLPQEAAKLSLVTTAPAAASLLTTGGEA